MVTEPKPHQVTRKRQNLAPDPFAGLPGVVGGALSPPAAAAPRSAASPSKRARTSAAATAAIAAATGVSGVEALLGRSPVVKLPVGTITKLSQVSPTRAILPKIATIQQPLCQLQTYESDILICGNCREVLPNLQKLVEHKRHRCRLRFTCRCQPNGPNGETPEVPAPVCAQCLYRCASWWELVCHIQDIHGMSLYYHNPAAAVHNMLNNNHLQSSSQSEASINATDNSGGDQGMLLDVAESEGTGSGIGSIQDDNTNDGDEDEEDENLAQLIAASTAAQMKLELNGLRESNSPNEEKGVDTADLAPPQVTA